MSISAKILLRTVLITAVLLISSCTSSTSLPTDVVITVGGRSGGCDINQGDTQSLSVSGSRVSANTSVEWVAFKGKIADPKAQTTFYTAPSNEEKDIITVTVIEGNTKLAPVSVTCAFTIPQTGGSTSTPVVNIPANTPVIASVPSTMIPSTTVPVTPSATVGNNNQKPGFYFEGDQHFWNTSEEANKRSTIEISNEQAHGGSRSLKLTTEIWGKRSSKYQESSNSNRDAYLQTELTTYFDRGKPDGVDSSGPYNLQGREVSCFVYVSEAFVEANGPKNMIQLFVKDTKYANHYGPAVDIDNNNANKWIKLSYIVGKEAPTSKPDEGFDGSNVNTLGIRVMSVNASSGVYSGSIYIDDCQLNIAK